MRDGEREGVGEEREWTTVRRRQTGNGQGRKKYGVKGEWKRKSGTTFFIRNFPEECTAEDLWWRFSEAGRVEDVFILEKRDKIGNRFVFVRFKEGGEVEEILGSLNKIWIGTYIIRAYIPRFTSGEVVKRAEESSKKVVLPEENRRIATRVYKSSRRMEGISYSEALKDSGRKEREMREEWEPDKGNDAGGFDERTIDFQSSEGEGEWLRGAFTGHLKDEYSWNEHGEEIQSE